MNSSTSGKTSQEHMNNTFMSAWISSLLNLWQTWHQTLNQVSPDPDSDRASGQSRPQMSGLPQSWTEYIHAANTAMQQSGMWNKFPEAMQQMPLITMNLTQVGMTEISRLAQDWMQGIEQAAQRAEEDLENPFQSFAQAYTDTWHKVFHFPPLGPERFRQQRINQLIDNGTFFANQFNQFMNQLAVPFEKATLDLHKKVQELAEGDGYPKTFQEYYNLWIKTLEGHFMVLFQSKEFSNLLNDVISQYVRFQDMQNQVFLDWVNLPVPSMEDFDALAHENYQLKKRIKQLASKVETIEEQIQSKSE